MVPAKPEKDLWTREDDSSGKAAVSESLPGKRPESSLAFPRTSLPLVNFRCKSKGAPRRVHTQYVRALSEFHPGFFSSSTSYSVRFVLFSLLRGESKKDCDVK